MDGEDACMGGVQELMPVLQVLLQVLRPQLTVAPAPWPNTTHDGRKHCCHMSRPDTLSIRCYHSPTTEARWEEAQGTADGAIGDGCT